MAATGGSRRAKGLSDQGTGLYEAGLRFWQKSYAGDYLGLVLLLAAYLAVQLVAEPFHKMFRLDNARIQYPHAEMETVPALWLFIYGGAVPLATLIVWTVTFRPSIHKAHVTILGLATTILLTLIITDMLKNGVGRPRPDLIARCKPADSTPTDILVTWKVCTETQHNLLHDGWRSWPSGHSSFAWSGLGYLALFLASQTHALRARASLALVLLCLLPLAGASFVAISRLEDYRHQVEDVICGSLLGMGIAYFNWRRYYPSLLSESCDEPHAPRGSGKLGANGGFQRVRDEEEGRFSISDESGARR
ncbi:hypothetical protein BAUCODRAFT_119318 [Baudoinia panamericana UAMH 10762]|uniref:Phosphatidic acid phosphatase type 2/haloperoxidase domain-containing protein n=1 Tax=Baudoinia panamericana (strain UAMH 10762) TaxID=717646 RepID=M2N6N0_BAUPA|nr:uncharacterized protein BAUCODRAFT_119318 [Baudoinia panamericana UAMH 10762]EMC99743.1 hypothetical protein BAUCODRAFT_119318 [Baudoinia panamericana UAMH 10762]